MKKHFIPSIFFIFLSGALVMTGEYFISMLFIIAAIYNFDNLLFE